MRGFLGIIFLEDGGCILEGAGCFLVFFFTGCFSLIEFSSRCLYGELVITTDSSLRFDFCLYFMAGTLRMSLKLKSVLLVHCPWLLLVLKSRMFLSSYFATVRCTVCEVIPKEQKTEMPPFS